jgi:hypothetical protein
VTVVATSSTTGARSSPVGSAVSAVRSRGELVGEREREAERIWGRGGMEREVFVRRRPASGGGRGGRGGRGRRDRGREGDRRRVEREREGRGRDRNANSGILPYNPVYQGDYLPDGLMLTYEELLSLDNGVVMPHKRNFDDKKRQELIEAGTTAVMFGASGESGTSSECVICLEGFEEGGEIMQMICGHGFHDKCLRQWFKVDLRCPTCRKGLEER